MPSAFIHSFIHLLIHSFIHSFIHATSIPPLFKVSHYHSEALHSTNFVSEFHAEAPQATTSEGLAQDPCVSARAGFEPATLRTKGAESTNEPQRPTLRLCVVFISVYAQTL